jgi:predicted HAD superfamily phosphohydrolase YqeG
VAAGTIGAVLVDLDNTIVRYGTPLASKVAAVAALQAPPGPVLSNSRKVDAAAFDGRPVVVRARKPFTRRTRLVAALRAAGAPDDAPIGVVGDLLTTDGLLAWRLGVPFYESPLETGRIPFVPTVHRAVGRMLRPLLFVVDDEPGGST